jgi:dienelactone hydrolase
LSGTLHEGEPRGKLETISGLETYVAIPKEGSANGNIVLYFPDVYGLFKNGQLIMDVFADAGYLAVGIDYFRGVSQDPLRCLALLVVTTDMYLAGSGLQAQRSR